MAVALHVEIVTPEAALWTGEASALMARSSDGEFTVLAQHTPLVGDVVPGLVRVATADGELAFVVHGGFFQVGPDGDGGTRATVLAGVAEPLASLDVARATAAKEAAEAVLAARGADALDDEALLSARGALARAELRLELSSSARRDVVQ
jgi:F-type H+-transporting ATPase subunit epsilon